jgi:hypothetical protein
LYLSKINIPLGKESEIKTSFISFLNNGKISQGKINLVDIKQRSALYTLMENVYKECQTLQNIIIKNNKDMYNSHTSQRKTKFNPEGSFMSYYFQTIENNILQSIIGIIESINQNRISYIPFFDGLLISKGVIDKMDLEYINNRLCKISKYLILVKKKLNTKKLDEFKSIISSAQSDNKSVNKSDKLEAKINSDREANIIGEKAIDSIINQALQKFDQYGVKMVNQCDDAFLTELIYELCLKGKLIRDGLGVF